MNGNGSLFLSNGDTYVGTFKDDKCMEREFMENGDKFIGEFDNNKKHGVGEFIWLIKINIQGKWKTIK